MWGDFSTGAERDRGQVFTLEGLFAGLVILVSILFALQSVTAVPGGGATGGSDGGGNIAQSALAAIDDETLRRAVLHWNPSDGSFRCTPGGTTYHPASPDALENTCGSPHPESLPPNDFGVNLSDQLGDGYQYNVVLRYGTGSDIASQRMVYQGDPGDGAVRARASVPLANDDELRMEDGTRSGTTLANVDTDSTLDMYAAPLDSDASDDDLYNVIHVEVVAWQS